LGRTFPRVRPNSSEALGSVALGYPELPSTVLRGLSRSQQLDGKGRVLQIPK